MDALPEPHVYICSIKFLISVLARPLHSLPKRQYILKPLGFPTRSTLISGRIGYNKKVYTQHTIGPIDLECTEQTTILLLRVESG